MKRWSLRICRKCGSDHGRFHDGCVTYSNPMFPQMTEHAGVDTIEVVEAAEVERMRDLLRRVWEFPDYPTPGEGMVSTEEDHAEQDAWREKWDALDDEVRAALADASTPEKGPEGPIGTGNGPNGTPAQEDHRG